MHVGTFNVASRQIGSAMPLETGLQIIRIGLVADEPIRVAGLVSVFEQPAEEGKAQLVPVPGSVKELLGGEILAYIVVDLHSSGFDVLETIHRARPEIRLIVIGPPDDDEVVISSIVAGARAYLEPSAGPQLVRQAIEVVTSGSIWAPRRLLSQLIDRLLRVPRAGSAHPAPKLTERERQVLELILVAKSNKEIAQKLDIEERTVKAYVGRLLRKTGADNRVKLTMSPLAQALLQADPRKKNRENS